MYSQIPGGPPIDAHALHVATDEVRHEIVVDPRVAEIVQHDPYTKSELFAHNPPVVDPPASSAYRPKPSGRRRKKKGFGHLEIPECDVTIIFIVLTFIPALVSLAVESTAYHSDSAWGEMIDDGDPFPTMSEESSLRYFDEKKFVIDTSTTRLAEVRTLVKRDSIMEAVAIGLIVVAVVIVLLALLMYMEGEAYKRTVVFAHFPAGLLALVAAVLIFVSDDQIDTNHLKAANLLELFFQDIMDYKNVDPFKHLHLEAVEEIGIQTLNLISIQKTCALGSTPDGRMSGSSNSHFMYLLLNKEQVQKITISDLRDLRFCSLEMYKHSAAMILLLYFIMCYIVPAVFYCHNHWAVVTPEEEDYDVDTDTEGEPGGTTMSSPPPAFGYYGGGGGSEVSATSELVDIPAVQERFDDRDRTLARGVDDLLEDDFATLAVLHKHAMKQAQDYDARNNLELGSNQSTMFISRPASPRGRGDSPADAKRIGELEAQVKRLSAMVDRPASRPTSAKKKKRRNE